MCIAYNIYTLLYYYFYSYFECKGMEPELFVIHITIKMSGTSSLLRISISNMYKRASFTSPNTIQVPFKFPKDKWTILSVDLLSIVREYSDLNPCDESMEWSWSIKNVFINIPFFLFSFFISFFFSSSFSSYLFLLYLSIK